MLKGLYVIADLQYLDARDVLGNVEAVLSAGARIIQYRDKISNRETRTAIGHKLRRLTGSYQALLIVNDDVELAKTIHADGVHLGKGDRGISEAVSFLGADKIIGGADGTLGRGMMWQGLSLWTTLRHGPSTWIPSTYMPTQPGRLFFLRELAGPLVAECN